MKIAAFSSLLVATLLVIASARDSQPAASSGLARRHHAKTARAMEEHQLSKRSFKGKATWYATYPGDMGACGTHLQQGDYFVALNQGQYGNLDSQSSYCGKTITITNGLKTTQATILDACPKTTQCHYGALDMSRDLFSYFNDFGVGVFDITWWINGEGGDSGSSSSSSNNNDSSDDDDAAAKKKAAQEKAAKEKAAQEKQDKEDAAKKAAAEKKKKEEEAAAKKKAAAEKKKKEEEEAKKKAAAKKKAEAKAAKQKAEKEAKEKIETAQHQNLAAFGEIMQQLNHLVADAITTDGGSSTASASASSSA